MKAPGFQILIVNKDKGAFNLKPDFWSLRPYIAGAAVCLLTLPLFAGHLLAIINGYVDAYRARPEDLTVKPT